jgi:hypothetical protein
MARRQGAQLHQLLDQLLATAALDHPETGQARARLVNAAALAAEVVAAAQLANPHQHITSKVGGQLPVHADPLAIVRILGNLLDNAATHTPAGTPIRLTAGPDGTRPILAVHDQGPGIPPRSVIASSRTRGWRDPPAQRWAAWGSACPSPASSPGPTAATSRVTDPLGGRGARFELHLPLEAPPAPDGTADAPADRCRAFARACGA